MNMNPEYQRELTHLNKIGRKLSRDQQRMAADVARQKKHLDRLLERGRRVTERELARINRRRSILEGRLSS